MGPIVWQKFHYLEIALIRIFHSQASFKRVYTISNIGQSDFYPKNVAKIDNQKMTILGWVKIYICILNLALKLRQLWLRDPIVIIINSLALQGWLLASWIEHEFNIGLIDRQLWTKLNWLFALFHSSIKRLKSRLSINSMT